MITGIFYTLSSIIAVVFVFLFAIEKFSRQIQSLAGDKFKMLVLTITKTPFRGTMVGGLITAIMQSSTATTVMTISLVQGGVIPFVNSLGIIFGANIGTTITTSLIAFQVLDIAPFILMFGFILSKLDTRYKAWGKPLFYFGLLFSSLFIISVLVDPLRNNPVILDLFAKSSGLFISIAIGIIVSTLFQASAIVSAIAVLIAGAGIIGFEQAFAIILGANIGTTTTGLIAASIMDKPAKRAAMAHFMFNVLGVLIIIPFIGPFSLFLQSFTSGIEAQVALAHVMFNVISALIALVFVNQFEKLILRLVP